jgi:hypothetical protein
VINRQQNKPRFFEPRGKPSRAYQEADASKPEPTWQETTDLSPEDDIEGGSEIYYFTDEDGNIHSRGFRTKELIPDALAKKNQAGNSKN